MKITDNQALRNWEEYRKNLNKSTTVDTNETELEKANRIAMLEKYPEAWFKYYFPNYYTAEPADFHIKATRRLIKNDRWYETRAWSRELAKTARAMMEFLHLGLSGKLRNILIVSATLDSAGNIMTPFKINLESNNRIINDYGIQEGIGTWEEGKIITRNGLGIRALGAGQSPRGTRNEEARPDAILIDDIDTDEECRNPKRIQAKWDWIEQALIPTVSVSGKYRILFNGNIIAKDCIIKRALEKSDYSEIINIRDKDGKSTWRKNSEEDIDYILSKISYNSAQKEYYNNPITEGTVFKDITWGVVPPIHKFRFVVAYGDPSPSNRENKNNSYKAMPLIGELDGKFYIFTIYLDQAKNANFITWYYDLEDYVNGKTQLYNYIENNSLQDPFWEQVISPLLVAEGIARKHYIHVSPDERSKPDKFARIEGNLEPLNRQGRLIFNVAERDNPHMTRLVEQFKAVDPQLSAHADGPDAVEGGVWIINSKLMHVTDSNITIGKSKHSSKRY